MKMLNKAKFLVLLIYPLFVVIVLFAIFSYSPKSILSGLFDPAILASVKLSLISAFTATVLVIIIGTPLAYYLAKYKFFGKNVIETLIDLPISIPPLVCGVGLLLLFGMNGWIGKNLMVFGIQIVFTIKGAVLAQFFIATPLYLQIMSTTFKTVDLKYETVARTLGSNPIKSFFKITVPLSWHGFINGTTMAFARCMGEFGATLMVASAITFKTETLPLAVFMNMSMGRIEHAISAASILIIISLFVIISMRISGNLLKRKYD